MGWSPRWRNQTAAAICGSSSRSRRSRETAESTSITLPCRLGLPIKGAGLPEGIEIFPRQDDIGPDEFGNAIRAPLGVHRGAKESRGWRFWFYNADYTLTDQLAYLRRLRKVTEAELQQIRRRQRDPG